jgi:hypothetical protein
MFIVEICRSIHFDEIVSREMMKATKKECS